MAEDLIFADPQILSGNPAFAKGSEIPSCQCRECARSRGVSGRLSGAFRYD
jgi:hypothetical protein